MLEFKPFTIKTLKTALPYIENCDFMCSDISAGALYMWYKGLDSSFCIYKDTLVIRQKFDEQYAFSYPVGKNADLVISELIEYSRKNDIALRFYGVTEKVLPKILEDERLKFCSYSFDRKWSDYVYSYSDAMTFAGKKFHGQRNHVNKFIRLYGQPDVRFVTKTDLPKIEQMLAKYESEHPDAKGLEKYELKKTRQLLKDYKTLGLYSACLVVGEEIIAFSIGEKLGNMFVIHVEKALKGYEGAYPTMYSGFLSLVAKTLGKPLEYVNREDDSGDMGLRESKTQYHPILMVDKYIVHVNSPMAKLGEIPLIEYKSVVLTEIKESDKGEYTKLCTDLKNNRFWGYDYRKDYSIAKPITLDTFYDSVKRDMGIGLSINFAIRLSENGEMIGECILWNFTYNGVAELGCRIAPKYHGHGYGQMAFKCVKDFAQKRLGLKVRAKCFLQNIPSYKMIVESGLKAIRQDEKYYYFE